MSTSPLGPVDPRIHLLFEPLDVAGEVVDDANRRVIRDVPGEAAEVAPSQDGPVGVARLSDLWCSRGQWVCVAYEAGWPAPDATDKYTEAVRLIEAMHRTAVGLRPLGTKGPDGFLPSGSLGDLAAYVGLVQAWRQICRRLEPIVDFAITRIGGVRGGGPASRDGCSGPRPKGAVKGKDIEGRMRKLLESDTSRLLGWSAEDWAQRLNCSKSTVHGTRTWKLIQELRAAAQAARRDRGH